MCTIQNQWPYTYCPLTMRGATKIYVCNHQASSCRWAWLFFERTEPVCAGGENNAVTACFFCDFCLMSKHRLAVSVCELSWVSLGKWFCLESRMWRVMTVVLPGVTPYLCLTCHIFMYRKPIQHYLSWFGTARAPPILYPNWTSKIILNRRSRESNVWRIWPKVWVLIAGCERQVMRQTWHPAGGHWTAAFLQLGHSRWRHFK